MSESEVPLQMVNVKYNYFRLHALFSIAGPTVWNSLPDELRDPACGPDSLKQFLNTILFSLY